MDLAGKKAPKPSLEGEVGGKVIDQVRMLPTNRKETKKSGEIKIDW